MTAFAIAYLIAGGYLVVRFRREAREQLQERRWLEAAIRRVQAED